MKLFHLSPVASSYVTASVVKPGSAALAVVVFALSLGLSGCGGMMAFRESKALLKDGQVDAGLAKLEEALQYEPNNAEYRISLRNTRASVINKLLTKAESARREGRVSEAEKTYQQVLKYDPVNTFAQQGLDAIVAERRHRQIVNNADTLFKNGTAVALAEALEQLRPVLVENPNQKDALNLKARIDEARARERTTDTRLSAAFHKPISLEFRDAPLKSVFDVIAKISGLNFFFDKDIRPDIKATVVAKNITVEDAVRLLLTTNQIEQKVLGENSVLIYPNTPQKQQDYQTLSVRTFFVSNADVKAISNLIKTIVKTKDLFVDERLGLITVRDTPEAIRLAERVVSLHDLSDPEVVLEMEVLELTHTRLLELGIKWPTQMTLAPLQVGGAPLTLEDIRLLNETTTQATLGGFTANLRKEDQDASILANPRIRVRNKEKAKVLIGDRVPVITTTSTSTGFVSESVSYVDVGLKLEAEPTVYLDDEVAIKVSLEVSSLVREVLSKSGSLSYQIGTRSANTVLRLKNGETQVLAGLISDADRSSANKVPAIGELPILGRLFGSQKDDIQRSEILLSITPHVVRSIRRPDLEAAEYESGTANSVGTPTLRLSTVLTPVEGKEASEFGASTGTSTSGPSTQKATTGPVGAQKSTGSQPVASGNSALGLSWQVPAQIKVGEQFSAVLRVSSQAPLRGVPLLVGYDPLALQAIGVEEGDFLKQGGGQTSFSERVDMAEGRVFLAAVRQGGGSELGVNGTGTLATITFIALKPQSATKLNVLSVTPDPAPIIPLNVPIEQTVKIIQ